MKDIISRCGFRCNLCLAYKENIRSRGDQKRVSDGWSKYFGFRVSPEEIRCDGCLTPDDEKPKLMDPECPVRPCALWRGLQNCAYCDEYIRAKLEQRIVDYGVVAGRFKEPIPEDDYRSFKRPYENRRLLDEIRRRVK